MGKVDESDGLAATGPLDDTPVGTVSPEQPEDVTLDTIGAQLVQLEERLGSGLVPGAPIPGRQRLIYIGRLSPALQEKFAVYRKTKEALMEQFSPPIQQLDLRIGMLIQRAEEAEDHTAVEQLKRLVKQMKAVIAKHEAEIDVVHRAFWSAVGEEFPGIDWEHEPHSLIGEDILAKEGPRPELPDFLQMLQAALERGGPDGEPEKPAGEPEKPEGEPA